MNIDKRIWIGLADVIFSLVVLLSSFFFAPEYADLVVKIVAILQVVPGLLIGSDTFERIEEKRLEMAAIERETTRLEFGREL